MIDLIHTCRAVFKTSRIFEEGLQERIEVDDSAFGWREKRRWAAIQYGRWWQRRHRWKLWKSRCEKDRRPGGQWWSQTLRQRHLRRGYYAWGFLNNFTNQSVYCTRAKEQMFTIWFKSRLISTDHSWSVQIIRKFCNQV